jgi:hypothetical protein
VRRAASAAGATIGVGAIPVTAPPGVIPGGGAEGPIITGLLPVCQSKGGKLLDKTRKSKDAIKTEQKLADDGKLGFKFQYSPLNSDATLTGTVGVGPGGGPRADLTVSDSSGNVIKHYVVGGDPADWADFGKWARQIGTGLGRDLIKDQSDDPCEPHAATVTVTYSGSYNVTATNYTAGEAMETQTENANWTFSWTGPLKSLSSTSGSVLTWSTAQLTGSTSDTHTAGGPNCSNGGLAATPGQSFDAINTGSPAAPQLQLSTGLPGYQAGSCALHLGCPGPPVSNGGDYCHPSVVWKPSEGEKTYTFSGSQNVGSVAAGRTVAGSAQTSVKVAPSAAP